MKVIGLLCGLSWLSTSIYYEKINRIVSQTLGEGNSAHIIMNSLNGQSVAKMFRAGHYNTVKKLLIDECLRLEQAGCDFIGISCNTLHLFYDVIQQSINIPIVHIIDNMKKKLMLHKIKKAGILATQYTIKSGLYDKYLNNSGIQVIYPKESEIAQIDHFIQKICEGLYLNKQEQAIAENICKNLKLYGADAIVLGCTELGLIIDNSETTPIFDSAIVHSEALAELSIHHFFDKNLVHDTDKTKELILV